MSNNFRFITQEYHKMEMQPRVPQTLTTAVSWRPEGLEYKKNEVFLDVIESVNMMVIFFFNFDCIILWIWYHKIAPQIKASFVTPMY